jgi:Zn-dependent M28 family amino/carboxypeptidase
MIVFTAHYEHLGMSGDTIFYGAHDNASGTAAVMDLARMANLQRGHYTYVFLLFGGEESGLIGSRYFADNPLIPLSKVKLLINIDLFCGGDEGLMVVNANSRETTPYVDLLQQINDLHGFTAKISRRDNARNSDHYYFTAHCPAIFIYTLGGPFGGYHSPTDTCDGCGLANYHRHMSLLRTFLEQLDK